MSSSPWLLSEDVLVVMSSELLQPSLSAPSSSSCSWSLSEERPLRMGAAHCSCLRRQPDEVMKILVLSHEKVCGRAHRRHYLRPEVAPGGESGLCWSCQSLSLILIVSSGASRHTKIQLMDKSIQALKIQHFISAWLLRKMSANTFGCSFPPTSQSKDGFNSETDLIHSSSYFRAKIHIWTSGVCNRSADHSFIHSRSLNLYLVMHI